MVNMNFLRRTGSLSGNLIVIFLWKPKHSPQHEFELAANLHFHIMYDIPVFIVKDCTTLDMLIAYTFLLKGRHVAAWHNLMESVKIALTSKLVQPAGSWALCGPCHLDEIIVTSKSFFDSRRALWEGNHSIDYLPDTKTLGKKERRRILTGQKR